jgi:hypothetical protein
MTRIAIGDEGEKINQGIIYEKILPNNSGNLVPWRFYLTGFL